MNEPARKEEQLVKKLTKSGNSYALLLDRAVLDLLNITPDTPLKITTNGEGLQVTPVRGDLNDPKFVAAANWAMEKYDRMLQRLAD